jgi:signal transduction histidine kinase
MKRRPVDLNDLLWLEVAEKSAGSSVAFMGVSVLVFFYQFGATENVFAIQAFAVLAFISSFIRLIISLKAKRDGFVELKIRRFMKAAISLNSLSWGGMFLFGGWEINAVGGHLLFLVTIGIGMSAASLVTLGAFRSLFYPFQVFSLGPMFLLTLQDHWHLGQRTSLYISLLDAVFILYQIRQFSEYEDHLIGRFKHQLELEVSNLEILSQQERLIQQTSKLMHSSKITGLGEMAAGLSHEINNSLMVILGSTEQMDRVIKRDFPHHEGLGQKVSKTRAAITKIKSVIDGLRLFSLENEQLPKDTVELEDIIDRTLTFSQELLKAHEIRLTLGSIPKVQLWAHPLQLTQILFNLIKNADDALREVSPQEKWIHLDFNIQEDNVFIRASNGGPPITEENTFRLFQPFFTTKDVGQGTGLSLSISRGLALDHKGDLYLDTKQPVTTFVLKLPIQTV